MAVSRSCFHRRLSAGEFEFGSWCGRAVPYASHPFPPHLPHKHNPSIHGHQKALTANRFVVVLFRFLPRPRRYPKFFPASPVDTWDVKIHSKNQVQNSSRVFRGFYRPTVQIWKGKFSGILVRHRPVRISAGSPYATAPYPVSHFGTTWGGVLRIQTIKNSRTKIHTPFLSPAICISIISRTEQGSGRSFKDRKPIGEVSCCDAWMATRTHWWTGRWLELCFVEWLQWSPDAQLLDVVYCSCTVVWLWL